MKLAYGVGVSSCKGMVTPLLYADFIDFQVGVTIPLKSGITSRVKGGQTRRRVLEGHNAPIRFTQNLDREATTQMGLAADPEWVTVGPPTTLSEDGAVGPSYFGSDREGNFIGTEVSLTAAPRGGVEPMGPDTDGRQSVSMTAAATYAS